MIFDFSTGTKNPMKYLDEIKKVPLWLTVSVYDINMMYMYVWWKCTYYIIIILWIHNIHIYLYTYRIYISAFQIVYNFTTFDPSWWSWSDFRKYRRCDTGKRYEWRLKFDIHPWGILPKVRRSEQPLKYISCFLGEKDVLSLCLMFKFQF